MRRKKKIKKKQKESHLGYLLIDGLERFVNIWNSIVRRYAAIRLLRVYTIAEYIYRVSGVFLFLENFNVIHIKLEFPMRIGIRQMDKEVLPITYRRKKLLKVLTYLFYNFL